MALVVACGAAGAAGLCLVTLLLRPAQAVSHDLAAGPESPEEAALRVVYSRRHDAIETETLAGWPPEVAEGRAAMRLAGLDPDDAAAVDGFNRRFETT